MYIRWTDTFQRRNHVDSTSKFTIGKVYFLRRIDVDSTSKSICAYMVYFFDVEPSTSILCRKVSVQTWYIFKVDSTSIQRWNIPTNKDCRFINVEYASIPRRCFTHGVRRFFDVECTAIQRRNTPIHKDCRVINVEYASIPCWGSPTV